MIMQQTLQTRVLKKTRLSERVVGLTLGLQNGGAFPVWEPGAHIELELAVSQTEPAGQSAPAGSAGSRPIGLVCVSTRSTRAEPKRPSGPG